MKETQSKSSAQNEAEIYLLPISAISHYLYCKRQAALIHIERIFEENALTISGNLGHKNVDKERTFQDHGLHKEFSMQVYSDTLKIIGIADVVEFPNDKPPVPVDYKNGRVASWASQEAQVTAIAFCLEEMLNTTVKEGAIYHIQSRKRRRFSIDDKLRTLTQQTIGNLHKMILEQKVPNPEYSKLCPSCSLMTICMPKLDRSICFDIFSPI